MLGLFTGQTTTGKQIRSKTFENLNEHKGNKQAIYFAKKFCEKYPNVRKGILFTGSSGSGKTHLAAAIANKIGHGVYWASMSELLAELRPGSNTQKALDLAEKCYSQSHADCGVIRYGSKPTGNCIYCPWVLKDKQPIIGQAAEAPLLVLDDIGTSKPTDWVAEQVYMLLNHRIEVGLPVIGTTNYTLDELRERLGHDRTVSRLVGLCFTQEVSGEDWRVKE